MPASFLSYESRIALTLGHNLTDAIKKVAWNPARRALYFRHPEFEEELKEICLLGPLPEGEVGSRRPAFEGSVVKAKAKH